MGGQTRIVVNGKPAFKIDVRGSGVPSVVHQHLYTGSVQPVGNRLHNVGFGNDAVAVIDFCKRRECGLEVLNSIVDEMAHPQPDVVIAAGRELLDDLRRRNVVIGTRV